MVKNTKDVEKENLWFLDWDWNIPSWFNKNWTFDPNKYDPGATYKIKWKTFRLKSNPTQEIEDPFDLDNLRFINKENVIKAFEKLEFLSDTTDKELICMVGTWWTISMTLWEDWKLYPKLTPEYLLKYAWGWLDERYWLVSFEFSTMIDSSQMEIDYMADVVIAMSWIYDNLSKMAKNRFCGFFVTHWTDTLSISATYAHVMLWSNCPFNVWFVAAQKSTVSKFSDVWVNFTYWLNMLSELRRAKKATVFLCMWWTHGWAYIPAATIKSSDSDADAFTSPWRKKTMDTSDFLKKWIDLNFINQNQNQMTIDDIFQPIILRWFTPITTLYANMWMNPSKLYEYVKHIKDFAIILVTYWSFTFWRKQIDAIVDAAKINNTILFATNPFPTWSTSHLYADAVYLSEKWIVPIHCLQHAAYAKIKWGQTVWWNNVEKIKMFLTWNNFIWEQPDEWEQPLEIIQEAMKINWYKMRKIGQPIESLIKI